jgi:hypothetical protein
VKLTPRWVSVALAIGTLITIAWAPFIYQFTPEVSSDHRSRAVLVVWALFSLWAAFMGMSGTILLRRDSRSGRPVAWVASIAMTMTCVGAIAGIPALIGLLSSRGPAKP